MRISPQRTEIAKLRCAANIPQKELADTLGVSVRHLRAVELGEKKSKSLLDRARTAFGK